MTSIVAYIAIGLLSIASAVAVAVAAGQPATDELNIARVATVETAGMLSLVASD